MPPYEEINVEERGHWEMLLLGYKVLLDGRIQFGDVLFGLVCTLSSYM